jgi:hypothetical protein
MNQESITPVLNKNVKRTEPECKDSVDVATKEAKKQDICEECTHDHTFRPSFDDVGHSIANTKVTRNRTRGRSKIVSDVCHGNTVKAYEIQGCYSMAKSELVVKVGPKETISLSLCDGCKTKFNDRGRTDVMIRQQNSEVVSVD